MPTETAATPALDPVMGELTTQHLDFRSGCSAYDGNPLIGALGKIRDRDEPVAKLSSRGNYLTAQQALRVPFATRGIQMVHHSFPSSYASACADRLLRRGYAQRNPLVAYFHGSDLKRPKMSPTRYVHQARPEVARSGPTGAGKTDTVRRLFTFLPSLNPHSRFLGIGVRLSFAQVPFLMLEVMSQSTATAHSPCESEQGRETGRPPTLNSMAPLGTADNTSAPAETAQLDRLKRVFLTEGSDAN